MVQDIGIRSSYLSRRLRLTTLIRLRWLAVAGQSVAVLFVALYLKFPFPVSICFALIACSAWLNLLMSFRYPINHRLEPRAAITVLAFDILQVAGLLYMTGGLQNPFAVLMIVPVIISATSLPSRSTMALGALVTLCATVLAYVYLPLPWYPGQVMQLPLVFIAGVWCSVVSALAFTAVYAYRVAEEARLLADALTATELTLQREQHLSALDGLAAAAAHELGTPLATIALVAKEMERALKQDDRFAEDVELLRSQTDRCREILKRLTSLSSTSEEHMSRLKISSLIEEVIEPNRNFGIGIEVTKLSGEGNEPVVRRNPGIIYGLGNLVENAVDFATNTVQVRWGWNERTIEIIVSDDGKGFALDILDRIGEPYTTGRDRTLNEHGGGLGLGLFIAKTLLERSGATITFRNRNDPGQGAEVIVTWPRGAIIAE
ncbi:ActS/PrrB/RegB family redox-sensitive histidine kinase [Phyllobacterium sp. 0TCS1.6C]|uniref:ActS/PrrB/RegB family redox-sensitive histidine kinase n=1 Tax=unclassified Phyllobacterium TaxID=2638441 RepID=UPI002264DAE9|nr:MULTISPECIES: ActS/PrrB/RegB family redox-sensitive histidine kinase [unclassified Phyllobacterium]MCX8282413.1 ActS/PrrB/RegB family redox-sensitive histidine kinase [Phyllobacterium sp. 0TCS1.6C]MCX8295234.1 ActS/PrrB/RegB family redox-sensitive histidine kinase [Phyllobacterium sp. 0TCS1.6A]